MIEIRIPFRSAADAATAMQALAAAGVEIGGAPAPVVYRPSADDVKQAFDAVAAPAAPAGGDDGDQEDDGQGGKRRRRTKIEIAAERHGVTVEAIHAAAGGQCAPSEADAVAAALAGRSRVAEAWTVSGKPAPSTAETVHLDENGDEIMPSDDSAFFDDAPAAAPAPKVRTDDENKAFFAETIVPAGKAYLAKWGHDAMRALLAGLGVGNFKDLPPALYDATAALFADLDGKPIDQHVECAKAARGAVAS